MAEVCEDAGGWMTDPVMLEEGSVLSPTGVAAQLANELYPEQALDGWIAPARGAYRGMVTRNGAALIVEAEAITGAELAANIEVEAEFQRMIQDIDEGGEI